MLNESARLQAKKPNQNHARGFSHKLVKYLKSNECAQRTSEISDTKPTSVCVCAGVGGWKEK